MPDTELAVDRVESDCLIEMIRTHEEHFSAIDSMFQPEEKRRERRNRLRPRPRSKQSESGLPIRHKESPTCSHIFHSHPLPSHILHNDYLKIEPCPDLAWHSSSLLCGNVVADSPGK